MEKIRKPAYRILYEDKDITRDISYFVTSVSYFDNIMGTADEISIELENRDGRWFSGWMPDLADRIKLYIGYEGEGLLFCGAFRIDQKRYKGFPETLSLRGNSYKTRVFENTTLSRIVNQIISENELQPFIKLKKDISIKMFSNWQYLENIPASLTIKKEELISYSIDDNNHTLYKEATVEYFDKEDNRLKTYTFKDPYIKYGETLKLIEKAENIEQAEEMAKSALRMNNNITVKIRLELMGDTRLVSGLTINLEGFGNYDGKYIISTAKHTINNSGYKTSVELRRCWNY